MATISKYITATGQTRWRVRYRTPDRRQTDKRGFTTKRDASAFAATVETQKLAGDYVSPAHGKVTVGQLAAQWSASRQSIGDTWRARQDSAWEVHVKPRWEHRPVSSITTRDIQTWVGHLTSADGAHLSPSSTSTVVGVLSAILDIAVTDKRIRANPARGVSLPRRASTEDDRTYLDADQVQMLAAETPTRYGYRDMLWLLATSGMRWGEAAALRPRDLSARGRIRLVKSFSKLDGSGVLTDLKGHESRTVAIPAAVETMLLARAGDRPRDALLWEAPRTPGHPMRPPSSGQWLDGAVQRCRASDPEFPEHVRVHDLRHTAASLMIRSGAHVKTIQRQLGHKSAVMTLDQYGHLFEDDLDVVATAMEVELFGEKCGQNVGTADSRE